MSLIRTTRRRLIIVPADDCAAVIGDIDTDITGIFIIGLQPQIAGECAAL
jgi:hypothetical protein